MQIINNSKNTFKASFSQDATTQKLLKQGIESNPYDVFEADNFLNRLESRDIFSLSSKETPDGQKFFIQRNNEKAVELVPIVRTGKSPIINVLKQLSYTIADGRGQFKSIFGSTTPPIGDFVSHANQVIKLFLEGANVQEYCDKISKLEQNNRALKFANNIDPNDFKNNLNEIMLNNQKIAKLKAIVSDLDKDFVRKSLRIK